MRAELLPHLKSDKRLLALDAELENLFSTWFDVAFLELRRISWDSPASLIEKLIKYEAVHDIRSWADVKNRLDSDRRCYGFFHPRLDSEPLIFVEVALMDEMADMHHAAAGRSGGPERPGQGHHRDLLFDQQHPGRPARRELRRFADQAGRGDAQGRVPEAQDLRHAVARSPGCGRGWRRTRARCSRSCPPGSAPNWAGPWAASRRRSGCWLPSTSRSNSMRSRPCGSC